MFVVKAPLPIYALALLALALASCRQASSAPSADRAAPSPATAAPSGLALAGRVRDAAEVLSPAQEVALSAKLGRLERMTHHQLVVVTVPSLGGLDVAVVARNLANRWRIGRKGYNDGVLLLVAPSERKVRIAVGFGLEGKLPYAVCKQIINDQMLPLFREGDLPTGIAAGVDQLIARIS